MGMDKVVVRAKDKDTNVVDKLKYAVIQTNVWNATQIDGFIEVSSEMDKMDTHVKVNDIELKQRTIFAYPEIAIGNNLMNDPFNKSLTEIVSFPIKLETAIKYEIKLRSQFSINLFKPSNLPFNISYDFWIRKNINSHEHPEENDAEIMIWLYRNEQKPIGTYSGDIKVDCLVNGKEQNIKFSQWVGRGNRWLTISYIIDPVDQNEENDIEISLSKFLAAYLNKIDEKKEIYYLLGIELGSEFGNPDEKRMELSWTLGLYKMKFNGSSFDLLKN